MAHSSAVCEGAFAINKPPTISSAQVIRDCQKHFTPSTLFGPWVTREKERKDAESHNQRSKRRSWKAKQAAQVKMGHGGTLDPMATGVLILGVGSGTKSLSSFLECTKSYETVVLFGAATDTYDTEGKIVARKPHEHVTRGMVEEALGKFRGRIMQRPPVFSALRVQGKRLYEYARKGKEVPVEIQERAVEVEDLEVLEWMDGGMHQWRWPEKEAEREEKVVVEKVLHLGAETGDAGAVEEASAGAGEEHLGSTMETSPAGAKRKREDEGSVNGTAPEAQSSPSAKRTKSSPEPVASGALPHGGTKEEQTAAQDVETATVPTPLQPCPAPAVRLRMTVTSGFYVRSLAHDLGEAVGSLGIMTSLVRTRQGDFELGKNVLQYDELAEGEGVWGPKVRGMLGEWRAKQDRNGEAGDDEVRRDGGGDAESRVLNWQPKPAARARVRRNTSSEED